MTKQPSQILVLCILAGLVASLTGCCWVCKYCHQVIIINQPQSRTVHINSSATFSVVAVKGPPYSTNGLSYQWQFNGTQLSGNMYWTNVANATNSDLTISSAQISDVGFYRVLVSGSAHATSDPASLQVYESTTRGTVTVYGTPVVSSSHGTCPGTCYGHVNYTNTPPAWGWAVIDRTVKGTAANGGTRTDTKVEYVGLEAFDTRCNANSVDILPSSTVPPPAVPPPHTPSSRYEFTIYFTTKPVPTGAYPITLTNFQ